MCFFLILHAPIRAPDPDEKITTIKSSVLVVVLLMHVHICKMHTESGRH